MLSISDTEVLILRKSKNRRTNWSLTASCSSLLLGLSKPSSKISSVVGSLAWDADDLDGELCRGAGVGATQRPCKKRKHRKCLAATIYVPQKLQGSGYSQVRTQDSSSYNKLNQRNSWLSALYIHILFFYILDVQEGAGPHWCERPMVLQEWSPFSSTGHIRKLVSNDHSWTPPQTYRIRLRFRTLKLRTTGL